MATLETSIYGITKKSISIVLIIFLSISLFASGAISSVCCCETSCAHCLKKKQAAENSRFDDRAHASLCCAKTQSIVNDPGKCNRIDILSTTGVVKHDRQTSLLWQSGLNVENCYLLHSKSTALSNAYPKDVARSAPIYFFTMTFLC